jgi:hypothetical protein
MNLIQKAIKKAKDFIDEKVMFRKFDLYVKAIKIEVEQNIMKAEENIENALKQGCFETALINFRTMDRIKEDFEYLDKFEKYVKEDRKE